MEKQILDEMIGEMSNGSSLLADIAKAIDTLTKAHYQKLYQEKIEALEELCAKQKELIMFYGKNIGDKAVYLSIHGISDSDEDIKKGEELRQLISELESKLQEVK
jgi:hypothetical protein